MSTKKVTKDLGLTVYQKRFCDEYVNCWNATEAYSKVYNTKNQRSKESASNLLLKKLEVQQYINKLASQQDQAKQVNKTYVLLKLKEIVEADYTQFLRVDVENENIDQALEKIPKYMHRLVQGFKKKKRILKDGTKEFEIEFKFMNKDKAIEMIAKHLGAFNETINVQGEVRIKTFTHLLTEVFDRNKDEAEKFELFKKQIAA